MKAARYWLTAILTDIALVALFYAWQVHGIEPAINVAVFWLWFVTAIRLLGGLVLDKTSFENNPRPAGFGTYHGVTEFIAVSVLVWFGFFWLAVISVIGTIMMEGARQREPKKAAEVVQ